MLHEAGATFIGQGLFGGTTMSASFASILGIEMPVAEDMQMGIATGISLAGNLVVCVYPRWNFLLLAANQLINHLDALPRYSDYEPKVIIRVAAPSKQPLNPGPQHDGDFTFVFSNLLKTVSVWPLYRAEEIVPAYRDALESSRSTILVEYTELYSTTNAPAPRPYSLLERLGLIRQRTVTRRI